MNMPGFSAQASLYQTRHHYATTFGVATNGSVVPQLSDSQLYWCRDACLYCLWSAKFHPAVFNAM
jgi:hypothetical protein